jgi:hypothetical protein
MIFLYHSKCYYVVFHVLYFLFILFQGNGKMSDSVSSTNDHGQIFVDPQPQAPTLPLVSGETSIKPVPTSTKPLAPVPPTFGDGTSTEVVSVPSPTLTSKEPVSCASSSVSSIINPLLTDADSAGQPKSTSGGKRSPSHMVRFWFLTVDLVLLSFSNF